MDSWEPRWCSTYHHNPVMRHGTTAHIPPQPSAVADELPASVTLPSAGRHTRLGFGPRLPSLGGLCARRPHCGTCQQSARVPRSTGSRHRPHTVHPLADGHLQCLQLGQSRLKPQPFTSGLLCGCFHFTRFPLLRRPRVPAPPHVCVGPSRVFPGDVSVKVTCLLIGLFVFFLLETVAISLCFSQIFSLSLWPAILFS